MSFHPLQIRRLAGPVIAALGLSASAAGALAQPSSATPSSGGARVAPGAWSSAFEGYIPFAPAQALPWREANEQVGRIGGWRAYAQEAQAAQAASPQEAAGARPAPASQAPAAPAAPAASAPAVHRH